MLQKTGKHRGLESKSKISVRLNVKLLAWNPRVRSEDPGQVYTTYIHARTKGIARMETKGIP